MRVGKEFGKLSPDQLARLLALRDGVHEMASLTSIIAKDPRLRALLGRSSVYFQWSWIYELPYAEMIASGLAVIGESGAVATAASADDPQESIIAGAEAYDPGPHRPRPTQFLHGIAYMMAAFHSLRAIELYSRPLNRLISDGRSGSDESFVKAVRVDPTCLSAPSVAKRISLASMRDERKFLRRIHKATVDGPNKGLLVYRKLRMAATLLDEAGAFRTASRERVFQVIVEELGLYEGIKGDPLKSLFRSMSLWRKDAAT